MNYAELTRNINDKCEYTFSADEMALFVKQAEQTIYSAVQIPALRKSFTGTLTQSQPTLTTPEDFLWSYSLAVVDSTGKFSFLLNKDVNFVREAHPDPDVTGLPKHYAYFNENTLIMGPSPDAQYDVELQYGYYPESIVTAGTTWLGDEFDSALFNGAMVEAASYLRLEVETIAGLEKLYQQSLILLKNLGDGKLREDAYRAGQYKQPVT